MKSTWTERAKAISFDPSGLVVVKGINVQTALEELDNYVSSLAGGGGDPGSPGADGESAYQIWLDLGNTGTEADFIASLTGPEGESAYQVWLDLGNTGTEADFIASLRGPAGTDGTNGVDGTDGASAYQIWLGLGNTGTEADFIASLTGPAGVDGADGGIEIAAAIINANYVPTNAQADVPGAQLVVPANSGPFELEVLGGVYGGITTGTQPANTVIQIQLQFVDEANTIVAFSAAATIATGTSYSTVVTIPIAQSFGNFTTDKTYRLQARMTALANGASSVLNFGGIFPARTMRAVRR